MKKLITLFLLLSAFNSNAQESFFRGNNNYQAPILFAPTISATSVVSNISRYGATSGAIITNNGGAPILASGVCWSATSNTPTIDDNKTTDGASFGAFTSTLFGLTSGVTYNVRAYATNSVGTSYGAVQSFTTSVKTIQTAVLIGSQVWTDKNLNVANYRNGDAITYAANATQWVAANAARIGAYTYLKYASGDGGATYGKLYNWYAVNDARGLAPTGYHIPTKAEWTTLRGTQPGNGKTLKSNTSDWSATFSNVNNFITFTPHPNYSNYNGTNSTGFNALPGGSLNPIGTNGEYGMGLFWTATIDAVNSAKANWTYFHIAFLYDGFDCCGTAELGSGMSIRLVKDNNIIETVSPTPTLTTTTSSSISTTSALVEGTVTDEGNTQVSLRGFVYGTSTGSSIYSVTTGSGAGTFTTTLTGLTFGTTYFVRSFATNVQGTSYGAETSFTTVSTPTVSSTATVTSITGTTAIGGGTITSDGGVTVTSRGLVWGTSSGSSTYNVAAGTGTGTFTTSISGLNIGTTYFVRAFATNSVGTVYGPEVSFSTPNTATVASTVTSTITSSTAILGGVLSSTGGATTNIGIMYSTASNFGTYTTTTINANAAVGTSYTTTITGLAELTTYYVKAYATNSAGTTYGPTISFTTQEAPKTLGQFYGGGVIFYILRPGDGGYDPNVQHGLIVSLEDQSTAIRWNNGTNTTTGATASGYAGSVGYLNAGTGITNTDAIIASQGASTSSAAGLARAHRGGGYTDWYLGSSYEMLKLSGSWDGQSYGSGIALNNYAAPYYVPTSTFKWFNGAGGSYWTSTETSSNEAVRQNFGSPSQYTAQKTDTWGVRAIRKF